MQIYSMIACGGPFVMGLLGWWVEACMLPNGTMGFVGHIVMDRMASRWVCAMSNVCMFACMRE